MKFTSSLLVPVLGLSAALGGCRAQRTEPGTLTPEPAPSTPSTPSGQSAGPASDAAGPPPAPLPPEPVDPGERVFYKEGDREKWLSASKAEADGYTLVNLADEFTPLIFEEHKKPTGEVLPNRYRRVFVGLANDTLDEDGQPLAPGAKNYLELFGIFPSLSVIRARFLEDAGKVCLDDAGRAALEAVETVAYVAPEDVRREEARLARVRQELEQERAAVGAPSVAALVVSKPELAAKLKLLDKRAADKVAFAAVEKRLACEGFLGPKSGHKPGLHDDAFREAIKRFQQKHMIYESHYLRRETMDALERSLLENDHRSLIRTLRERVAAAAGIIEDGTGTAAPAPGAPPYNLADELTKTAAEQLGLDTPEAALAFFQRRQPNAFAHLRGAVKLPPLPAYYGKGEMELSVVIDRGDVWYDLAFDEKSERLPQARKKYPTFTLFVKHGGKRVPLIRWRTTIGGWRAEQASDGYEYYRYKGSDVGPRAIRQVIAGPVWIAPASTPIRSMVRVKYANRHKEKVVNYSELGPGYTSAYGLVAGYFVIPSKDGRSDWDNGIRAHGSAEYLSMYSPLGYSHGCHRLPNHLAIRLYSFLLRHRPMRVVGDLPVDMARQFLKDDEVFEIRIPSRGYAYMLDPPLPVEVLEGEIKGTAKEPILGYVPKPGMKYPGPPPPVPGESPEERAGGAAAPAKPGEDKPAAGEEPESKP